MGETDLDRARHQAEALAQGLAEFPAEGSRTRRRILVASSQLHLVLGTLLEEEYESEQADSRPEAEALRRKGIQTFEEGVELAEEALQGTLAALDESGTTDFPSRIDIDRLRRKNVPAAVWGLMNYISRDWLEGSRDGAAERHVTGLQQHRVLLRRLVELADRDSQGTPCLLLALADTELDPAGCVDSFETCWRGSEPQTLELVFRARNCAVAAGDRSAFRSDLDSALERRSPVRGESPLLREIGRRQAARFLAREGELFPNPVEEVAVLADG